MSLKRIAGVALPLFALALGGCDQAFQNRSTRALNDADKKAAAGDYRAAVAFYEEALDGTAKTAEIHYKLALIYDDKLKDSLSALHHFHRYLEVAPSGPHAKDARAFVKQDELHLLTTLSQGGMLTQEESKRLRNEVATLRQQIAELRAPKPSPPPGIASVTQKPVPVGARTYTVQKGDTLASISRHYYKTSARWKDIQDANFYNLKGTATLRVGQTLVIPK